VTQLSPVRVATVNDRQSVVDMVVSAFAGDPLVAGHLFGPRFAEWGPLFFGYLFDVRVDDGEVWVTDALDSVAMWTLPGGSSMSQADRDRLWESVRAQFDAATDHRVDTFGELMQALKPAPPFWYLGVLATRPQSQGRGLASSVVQPVLSRADEAGLTCGLETASRPALALYARLGFSTVTDAALADGTPLWWLERPPQPPART